MYDVYYHKQNPTNPAESPDTSLGMATSPAFNQGITVGQGIGIATAAMRVVPAAKQIVTMSVNATGSLQTQLNYQRLGKGAVILTEFKTLGLGGVIAIEGLNLIVEAAQVYQENKIATINQEYNRVLNGASINKFTGRGDRL